MILRRSLKLAGGFVGVSLCGTALFATYHYNTGPGVRRTMQFCYKIAPMVIAYARATGDKERTERLHAEYAPKALQIVLEMKGCYIKAAQMLCGVGVLPETYEKVLKILLDDVSPSIVPDAAYLDTRRINIIHVSRSNRSRGDPRRLSEASLKRSSDRWQRILRRSMTNRSERHR